MQANKAWIVGRVMIITLVCLGVLADGVCGQGRTTASPRDVSGTAASGLNGVYRIDAEASDKLYSVVAGVSSNLPFGEQQRFFIDLAVRLTPPDLLAVERRGRSVSIGSSRAPRVTLVADGVVREERYEDGRTVRSRVALEGDTLTFTATGKAEDNFSFVIQSLDDGRRIRVTRRIYAAELSEPVVIKTIYNKVSEVARWDIYGESTADDAEVAIAQAPRERVETTTSASARARTDVTAGRRVAQEEASLLRDSLTEWIDATNRRALDRQMMFYVPELSAFYLKRNVNRAFVRAEKSRAFTGAKVIEISAAEPEIIFQDEGRTAIMRFRKKYRIEGGAGNKRGEVIQELRWRRTEGGWKIYSERDVRVIS